jgi:hypothetical protein
MMHAEQQKLFAEITVFSQAFGKFPAMASIHPCASAFCCDADMDRPHLI